MAQNLLIGRPEIPAEYRLHLRLFAKVILFQLLLFVVLPVFRPGAASEFRPDQSTLPVPPPEGAFVLFAGRETGQFLGREGNPCDWPIVDGTLVSTSNKVRANHILTKVFFRDAEIHVEFNMAKASKGNSGLYIHGHYEMQIFDSVGTRKPGDQDIGALYGFHAPLVNAGLSPGQWQVYDLRYRAPRRDAAGAIVENGRISAWLNGQEVLHEVEFGKPVSSFHPYRYKATPYLKRVEKYLLETGTGPLFLQDHDSPCRFRNIWIKPLDTKTHVYTGAP